MRAIEQSPVGGWLLECVHLGVVVKSQRFFGTMMEACYKLDALNAFAGYSNTWRFVQKEGVHYETNGN